MPSGGPSPTGIAAISASRINSPLIQLQNRGIEGTRAGIAFVHADKLEVFYDIESAIKVLKTG